jgi:hypothetical protein
MFPWKVNQMLFGYSEMWLRHAAPTPPKIRPRRSEDFGPPFRQKSMPSETFLILSEFLLRIDTWSVPTCPLSELSNSLSTTEASMETLAGPLPNDIARLCPACQEAINHIEPPNLSPEKLYTNIDTEYWLEDEFPPLPKLELSSRQGCDFCDFVREIILSGDASDSFKQVLGKTAADLGTLDVEISIFFHWVARENHAGPSLRQLVVRLWFVGIASPIELVCFVEATIGTLLGLCYLHYVILFLRPKF